MILIFEIYPTSNSNGQFSFTIENPTIASINENKFSILQAGVTTIITTQASERNYNSGSIKTLLTVLKADPVITFNDIIKEVGDPEFNLDYNSNSDGLVSLKLKIS